MIVDLVQEVVSVEGRHRVCAASAMDAAAVSDLACTLPLNEGTSKRPSNSFYFSSIATMNDAPQLCRCCGPGTRAVRFTPLLVCTLHVMHASICTGHSLVAVNPHRGLDVCAPAAMHAFPTTHQPCSIILPARWL